MDEQILKPDNHLALAVFTTVCCCLPFGIIAIIKANNVDTLFFMKQYNAAILAANEAKKWSYIGIGISITAWVIYMLFFGGLLFIGSVLAI